MSDEEKGKKPKISRAEALKILLYLFPAIGFACNSGLLGKENPTQPVESEPDITQPEVEPNLDITETMIQEGEGLIAAIERACSEKTGQACSINEYSDLGILWKRNGQPYVYIHNLLGLHNLAVIDDLGGTWVNDEIAFGTVSEINTLARQTEGFASNVVQVIGRVVRQDNKVIDQLQISGGQFKQPIVFISQRAPERGLWQAQVGQQTYTDLEAALQAATQEP